MVNSNTIQLSSAEYIAPILAFLIVVLVMGALLKKTKLFGENGWIIAFLSIAVGILFIAVAKARAVLLDVTPWFAVMLVALFFILLITGFIGKTGDIAGKRLGIFFVVLLGIAFFISLVNNFSSSIFPYLPGPGFGFGGDPEKLFFFSWLYSPQISGTIWLAISALVVGWIFVRGK